MALQTPLHGAEGKRLVFIDALRVAAIIFVIIHHAAQAYGPTGGFWPVHDRAQSDWFAPFYTANAAFGMGLMFLIAGYFAPPSYDRKGARLFLMGRWLRIGIPLASLVLLLNLPVAYFLAGMPAPREFLEGLYARGWQPIYLHLWFVAHLLLYCFVYAVLRQIFDFFEVGPRKAPLPSPAAIVFFIVALALITWLVRIWYPIDKWAPFLWIMPAEPAHLPQYLAFFAVGVVAYRGDWFRRMPTAVGLIWLAVGAIAFGGVYIAYAFGPWSELMAAGGSGLSSLIRSSWETVIAVGLSVGLIVAFRELFDRADSRLLEQMAAASFGAYILHPAIVVAMQAAMTGVWLVAFAKFVIVSLLATVASFGIAHVAGRARGVRAVLGQTSGGEMLLSRVR
ncbi:MAG TPA: acyltransferase family protein [Roseiarcus sp.]|nr:acyltransferase family protein [Roseiarcus sp.]